jgi:hypothetical protein
MNAVEEGRPAALGETSLLRGVHKAHDLVEDECGIVLGQVRLAGRFLLVTMTIYSMSVGPVTVSVYSAMQLSSFTHQFSRH